MKLTPLVDVLAQTGKKPFITKSRSQCCVAALLSLSLLAGCGSGGSSDNGADIIKDTTAPVITLNGESSIVHAYGTDYVDAGAVATDDVDSKVTVISSGTVLTNVLDASYTLTYSATDSAGNVATPVTRVVKVTHNGPTLTINEGKEYDAVVELGQGRIYRELALTAYDNYDGEEKVVDIDLGELVLNEDGTADILGSYEVTYSAEDSLGNVTEATRTVNVVERRPFITTWDTRIEAQTDEFTITIPGDSLEVDNYHYQIDCGEDAVVTGWQTVTTADLSADANFECTYSSAGIKTIQITDNFTDGQYPQLYFNWNNDDSLKLLTIEQWGDIKLTDMESAFFYCRNLEVNAIDMPDLRLVESMDGAFNGVKAINVDISGWDVSPVTNMQYLFAEIASFNQNLAKWQVKNATNMRHMFDDTALSTANYDATLIGWSAQELKENVELGADMTARSSASDDAVAILEALGWDIEDATPTVE